MNKNFLNELRRLNIERQKEWDPENKATLSFKGLEFAGEAGELASKIKKLARKIEFDFVGSDYDMTDIENEVGDVLITLDLVCQKMGIDIEKVTKKKFNATSDKVGMTTKFEPDFIYIEISDDNSSWEFDRRIKEHVEMVSSLKPHIALLNDKDIGLIFAPEGYNYEKLNEIYKRHYVTESPDRFILTKQKDISVPKKHRNYLLNIVAEPYETGDTEKLYCVTWNNKKYHIYSDNGENAMRYIAYTRIPMGKIDLFLSEVHYYVTQPFLLS